MKIILAIGPDNISKDVFKEDNSNLFICWGFTPLSTLFQLYNGNSSLIHEENSKEILPTKLFKKTILTFLTHRWSFVNFSALSWSWNNGSSLTHVGVARRLRLKLVKHLQWSAIVPSPSSVKELLTQPLRSRSVNEWPVCCKIWKENFFQLILSRKKDALPRLCSRRLLKSLWQMEELLIISNLFFSHNVNNTFQ